MGGISFPRWQNNQLFNSYQDEGEGISLEDYSQIFQVLAHIEDIDKALTFHHLAGSPIGPGTLHHVSKVNFYWPRHPSSCI
jgi:hypothetical protein